jgi:nucleoside phosphorylase
VVIDQALNDKGFLEELERGLDPKQLRPQRRIAPILAPAASGSAVIADAQRLMHIEQQHRKVAALDMEIYGLYYAAHEWNLNVEHYFATKCVVDLADAGKSDDLHAYGCAVSARAAVYLLKALLLKGR